MNVLPSTPLLLFFIEINTEQSNRKVPGSGVGCSARAQYLSPPVAVDLVGTEGAERSGAVSPERFQTAMSKLQPSGSGPIVREVQGRNLLAHAALGLLSGTRSTSHADGGGLCSSLARHLPRVRESVPRAQPVCARQIRGARLGGRQL